MGSTLALQSSPEYLEFFRCYAVLWVPVFIHAPIDQGRGPLLAHLKMLALSSGLLGKCLLCPLLLSLASSPWEEHRQSGRLSTAALHLLPSEALSTSRGASSRRQTSEATSGSSHPAALERSAPTVGFSAGGALPACPPLLAGSDLTLWPSCSLCQR